MKIQKLKSLITAPLLFAFCLQMFAFNISAQKNLQIEVDVNSVKEAMPNDQSAKMSPELQTKSDENFNGLRSDSVQKVIIRVKTDSPLKELGNNNFANVDAQELIETEVRINKEKTGILLSDLNAVSGKIKKSFNTMGLVSAELPLSQVKELVKSDNVEYISADSDIQSFGHVSQTTGWSNTGIADSGDSDPNTWTVGGVGTLAIIDSGIDTSNELVNRVLTTGAKQSKVVFSKDFTGQNITGDPFGHGSHVASLVIGDHHHHASAYEAIAPGADVLNLRVLNSTGTGSVSTLISALDWVVQNKAAYDIRVVNMSLGTPAKDSYINDPLCLAARRAVDAGIVVVASAGNYGKDSQGNKQWGSIGSPGIEPSVITVGAVNTLGTDSRTDDTVATFSSRGPTRGYKTVNGARKYDNLIKPDIVAPGNKIIGARSYYAGTENYLARTNTVLRVGNDVANTEKLMYMSGTSMAAPVVAGAAMDVIQTNPSLTPNLVKAILMYSAQPLKNATSLEQGAGEVNIDGAVRIARLVKTTIPTTNGAALLNAALPASQSSLIGGQTVYWGTGVVTNFGFLYGSDLMNKWQGMYANGVIMGDGTPFATTTIYKSTARTSGTLNLYTGAIKNNGVIMGDGTMFLTANAMGSSPSPTYNSQGVLVSDGVVMGDGVIMGDGVVMGDAYSTTVLGDNTTCMQPAP